MSTFYLFSLFNHNDLKLDLQRQRGSWTDSRIWLGFTTGLELRYLCLEGFALGFLLGFSDGLELGFWLGSFNGLDLGIPLGCSA